MSEAQARNDNSGTPLTSLLHCPQCSTSSPMIIKAVTTSGLFRQSERVEYVCTKCGAERLRTT